MGRPDYYSFSVGHFNSYQKLDNLSVSHVLSWSYFEGVVTCLVQCGIKYQRCCLSVGVSHCRGTKLLFFFFLWLCKYRCGQIGHRQHLDEHCCPQPSDSTRRDLDSFATVTLNSSVGSWNRTAELAWARQVTCIKHKTSDTNQKLECHIDIYEIELVLLG